jgi:acyl-CoA reductase-like NAD-dependent aldehyde dehydrogenase
MSTLAPSSPSLADGRTLFIGGNWSPGEQSYERFDPARLERSTGTFAVASAEHVRAAYEAAAAAQPAWAATSAPQRSDVLRRAADLLEERADEAAHRLTSDMGKVIRDARAEVLRSAAVLRYFSGELLQPTGETYPSADPATLLLTVEEPLGVVCVITPWNFPFAIPTWKLAPAIGFGNAVVWKPAEAASGSAVMLAETLAAAGLPDGVINLVTGRGREMSDPLTGDPRIAALSFTGSGPVGTRLRQAVADRNVKVQLELGGKNPAIVLADADLADAAVQVARGAMLSTGQRCTATSRVYVERSAAGRFRELLREAVEGLVVGDPFDDGTDVGPLSSTDQWDTVNGYLQIASDERAEVIAGTTTGKRDGGCFVAPTVLAGVDGQSRLVREEIFGPVVVVQEVEGFDEALELANDTEFGLSSALFTRDIARALKFVRGTQSGVVHINRETAGVEPHVPFGGIKGSSSMSREQGKAARQFFTTTKTVYIRPRD